MDWNFDMIQAVTNFFVIIGVIIALIQLYLSRKIAKMDFDRRKKESTIMFTYGILMELDKLAPIIKENDTVNYDMYMKEENEELHNSILQYLKFMERICVGINTGVYDFDVFQRICGWRVWKRWLYFQTLVNEIRKNNSMDNLYIEYENVADDLGKLYKPTLTSKGKLKENL